VKIFKVPVNRVRERAAKLLSRTSSGEVMNWTDVNMAGAWKAMEDFRKHPDSILLEEAERGLQQALGGIDALKTHYN
jgi:hypothetical protein